MTEKVYENDVSRFVVQIGAQISEEECRVLTFVVEDDSCSPGCGYPYRFSYLWSTHPNEVLFKCSANFKIHLVTGQQQIVVLEGSYKSPFNMTVKALLHFINACRVQVLTKDE